MCGIFGIINPKKQYFNRSLFNVLGILNDSRGGDSCGIFIDGKLEYGVDENKLYYNFLQKSKILKETRFSKIALGHCRKASVGTVSNKTAQPVVIYKNGKPDFVLIHNGTIYNYAELAEKYIPDMDITGMTDSQIMANIFYYAGYDCLSEYCGGSVFLIVDYRENPAKILVYKGQSREFDYFNSEVKEERPFYFTIINDSLVFSSIPTYFKAFKPNCTVNTVNPNILIEIKGLELYIEKEYPRDKMFQSGQYRYTNGKPSGYKQSSNVPANTQYGNKSNDLPWEDDDEDYYTKGYTKGLTTITNSSKYIYYTSRKDLYILDGKNVTGTYLVSKFGKINPTLANDDSYTLNFWDGVLLKNKNCLNFLNALRKKSGVNVEDFIFAYPDLIYYLSAYPLKEDFTNPESPYVIGNIVDVDIFTGSVYKVLSGMQLIIENGKKISELMRSPTKQDFDDIYDPKKERIQFHELRKYYLG